MPGTHRTSKSARTPLTALGPTNSFKSRGARWYRRTYTPGGRIDNDMVAVSLEISHKAPALLTFVVFMETVVLNPVCTTSDVAENLASVPSVTDSFVETY